MVLWRSQWGIFLKKIQIDWIKIEHTVSKTKEYFFFLPTSYILNDFIELRDIGTLGHLMTLTFQKTINITFSFSIIYFE